MLHVKSLHVKKITCKQILGAKIKIITCKNYKV